MIWAGQFGIVEGEALEESPWVGAFPDRSGRDDPSDLYVVAEPALPGSEEFCEELKEAIGEAFHRHKLSLTGGMLRALRTAHEDLREWNRKSIKEHRVAAGVSCLAVRPAPEAADGGAGAAEAYLGQVAPAAALLYRGGALYPFAPRLPEAAEPLGLYDELRPDFTRLELGDGDRVLLLSPSLAGHLPESALLEALALPHEEILPALYRQARGVPNCAAILIAALPEAE
jgi:hypothetical protein